MFNSLIYLDQQLFLLVNSLPHPQFLVFPARFFSGVGALGLIWFVLGLLLIYFERHHPKIMLVLAMAIISAGFVASGIIKQIVGRLRPEFVLSQVKTYTGSLDWLSFPSGHSAIAFAAAFVLASLHPKRRSLFFALAALIALSRVYLGVHYFSDIIAGVIVGLVCGLFINKITYQKTLAIFILLFTFGLLIPRNTLAKTVLVVEPANMAIYEEEQVLGIASDNSQEGENQPNLLNLVEKVLNIKIIGQKIVVGLEGETPRTLGAQEVDELILKKGRNELKVLAENNKAIIQDKLSQAITQLPISFNQSTGELVVQTLEGPKEIKLTPDSALREIEKVLGVNTANLPVKFELTNEGAKLNYVYEQNGEKKLFGFLPIKTNLTTQISAQTGEVKTQFSPWFYKILKNLSV